MTTPVIIGLAGGTGSGKSTITNAIRQQVKSKITIMPQDSYYKNFSHLPKAERDKINFDHPDTFDNELFMKHIKKLLHNKAVKMPIYNFKTHSRTDQTITKLPTKLIIVEGILIFENPKLRDLMDIKVFVDTDADIRILRRIERDMEERGRNLKSIIKQYRTTVRPMHNDFVEPSKKFANIIIPEGGKNEIGIDMIVTKINQIVK